MMTNLLETLKLEVIPKLKPTVLYAEKHSKAMSMSFICGSNSETAKIPIPITINDKEITAKALRIETLAISLR